MNFLSHYYFDRFDRSPELVLGSIMPDLLRNASKESHVHLRPERNELAFLSNPKLVQLYRGWQRHMETDRLFHNSSFFYEKTHVLKLLIGPIVKDTPIRPSFLSHIALELVMDHLLLTERSVDETDFYHALEQVDRPTVERFLKHNDVSDTSYFFTYFDHFLQEKYVGLYRDLAQVSQALMHICRRLWDFERNSERNNLLTEQLKLFSTQIRPDFHLIFEEIELKLT